MGKLKQFDGNSGDGPPGTPGSGGEGSADTKQKVFQPTESSERIRNKRLNSSSNKWISMMAALSSQSVNLVIVILHQPLHHLYRPP